MIHLDLENPIHAYIFGFLQADGSVEYNLNKHNYRISLEIHERDLHLLSFIKTKLDIKSNIFFRPNRPTSTLFIYSKSFVEHTIRLGIPAGKKSKLICPPQNMINNPDYWRGIIDADGSVGFFNDIRHKPFIGLTTSSESLASGFISFANTISGKSKLIDSCLVKNIYRITYYCEDAQKLCNTLYYPGHLPSLHRKNNKAKQVKNWERTYVKKPLWSLDDIEFIKTHSIKTSIAKLGRTDKAIREKLRRTGFGAKDIPK